MQKTASKELLVRFQIRLPVSFHKWATQQAIRRGVSLNQVIVDCVGAKKGGQGAKQTPKKEADDWDDDDEETGLPSKEAVAQMEEEERLG